MNNYQQNGESLSVTAPRALSSGDGVQIGALFGVAFTDAAEGDAVQISTCGVYSLDKTTSQAWADGQPIYWDDTNYRADSSASVGPLIGHAVGTAASADTTGNVKLRGVLTSTGPAPALYTFRRRSTIAEVNAGVSLLPALSGYKYRLVDAYAITVGGAAGAVTTVDLLGTQSASPAKLVAWAQASLTQSTLLRAGASGATILADGASFVACDADTAITLGKTGSDITTATHVDVSLLYTIEPA